VGGDLFRKLVGRGSAYLDYDADGDLDLIVTENNGPARLYRNNNTTHHHWVRLLLQGDGILSNRSAIGSHVIVEAGGRTRNYFVAGARGYLSQSELAIAIGLGPDTTTVDRVTVRWPSKQHQAQSWSRLHAGSTYQLIAGQSHAKTHKHSPGQ
jgi:enediyne biosynthesis protein E4